MLATLTDERGDNFPALIAQPFGSGRVASVAVGDLWRWGQHGANEQADLARFWRQMSRWLVTDVPAQVELRAIAASSGEGVELRVSAKDREFQALELASAKVTVKRIDSARGAEPTSSATPFQQAVLNAEPAADVPGRYTVNFNPREAGAYLATAEVKDRTGRVVGRAEAGWVTDPAAEEFRSITPNRTLLEALTKRTGGAIVERSDLNSLAERLARAPAPITETTSRSLWHNPWMFAAVLGFFLAEWGWRRWRGLP